MAYQKQTWENRVVDSVTGHVIKEGTRFTDSRMNHMEDGIEGAHNEVVAIAAQLGTGGSFVAAGSGSGSGGLVFTSSGLTASWTAGVAFVKGVRYEVAAGSLPLNATQGQYIYLDADGVVKLTTSKATADAKCPLWYFATDASRVTTSTSQMRDGAFSELFKSVGDGKAQIATAVTGKGGTVVGTVPYTFQQLVDGVNSIKRGTGNAVATDVLAGKTFSNDSGPGLVGTMPNNGAVVLTPSGAAAVPIPAGYHNGSGTVAKVNVPADKVLTGTNIVGVAGTMPNIGAMTIVPSTIDQAIPIGFHNGAGLVQGDPDLLAANIKNGINIFGVAGSIARSASGGRAAAAGASATMDVRGLAFRPSKIVILNARLAYPFYYGTHMMYGFTLVHPSVIYRSTIDYNSTPSNITFPGNTVLAASAFTIYDDGFTVTNLPYPTEQADWICYE